ARVAPRAHRPMGVLLLRRHRGASTRSASRQGTCRLASQGAVREDLRQLPGCRALGLSSKMSMDLCERSPSYVRAIAPYQPGKPISELAREIGLKEKNIIKLASNENPLGVSPRAKAAIKKAITELGRYPDGNAFDLKAALSTRYGVPEDCIVVGNGS